MMMLLGVVNLLSLSCGFGEQQAGQPPAHDPPAEIIVAAAANLTGAFQEIGNAFSGETGIKVIYNFGATTQLTQQIKNGAPFDVFAAADVFHVDQLVENGKIVGESRAVYARGRLALWVPDGGKLTIRDLADLVQPAVRIIAIANPEIAPYGAAAVEALKKQSLWEKVESKFVRAENVNAAKQLAATGNAEAAFTAYSLVLNDPGKIILIAESLHSPLDQAIGVVAASSRQESARRFEEFILHGGGRAILQRFGYGLPTSP